MDLMQEIWEIENTWNQKLDKLVQKVSENLWWLFISLDEKNLIKDFLLSLKENYLLIFNRTKEEKHDTEEDENYLNNLEIIISFLEWKSYKKIYLYCALSFYKERNCTSSSIFSIIDKIIYNFC